MSQRINTVIVGGGQAGLAISYYLKQEGPEHVILERTAAVANAWRNERWDSFTLVTPNFQVPGAEYNGNDPYGFMTLAEVVKYFDDYVERFGFPRLPWTHNRRSGILVGVGDDAAYLAAHIGARERERAVVVA